ncbi:nucleotidyltransferase domain-containing protein [Massilia sp. METH4]|uniref:nucleotidyltransferase domain-containing protein n=1 Tax=Massilia sp. METH4 TaxID=3123041 RepID=UPI0030CDD9FD
MHIDAARHLVATELLPRWPDARVAIIGGSIARGEATPTSDIDLLLVFDRVDQAWRDTLKIGTQTVELFGHDPATFDYFCREIDRPNGRMPLADMVVEGVSVMADGDAAAWLRTHARQLIDAGPPPLTEAMLAGRRYGITTLLEDLIDGTAPDETLATAVRLYDMLAHFALRAAGAWSGEGKHLARRLRALDPGLADELVAAMAAITADSATGKRLFDAAVRRTLAPFGGLLLEGFTLPAPVAWRSEGVAFPGPATNTGVHMDEP